MFFFKSFVIINQIFFISIIFYGQVTQYFGYLLCGLYFIRSQGNPSDRNDGKGV